MTLDELYEELKPIRAHQILWNACQHIDVFARGNMQPAKGDVLAIGILRAALGQLGEPEDEYERRQRG